MPYNVRAREIKRDRHLRSMGYRRRDISAIFLWQGALIAAADRVMAVCSVR